MIRRTVSAAMTMMVVFATGMGCIGGVNGESVQLTVQNFEQMVSGKTIFIKVRTMWTIRMNCPCGISAPL
jgi:hypothetical protein